MPWFTRNCHNRFVLFLRALAFILLLAPVALGASVVIALCVLLIAAGMIDIGVLSVL